MDKLTDHLDKYKPEELLLLSLSELRRELGGASPADYVQAVAGEIFTKHVLNVSENPLANIQQLQSVLIGTALMGSRKARQALAVSAFAYTEQDPEGGRTNTSFISDLIKAPKCVKPADVCRTLAAINAKYGVYADVAAL